MMNNRLIGAVVVYNPGLEVIQNILSYVEYLDYLIVVDNSESSSNFYNLNFSHPRLIVFAISTNVGIAKALNMAANYAFEKEYNWMLVMDQDSRFNSTMISGYINAFSHFNKLDNAAIVGPESYSDGECPETGISNMGLEKTQLLITSGSIINLNIWNKLNGFNEVLFIDEVDHEYCLKSLRMGYSVYKIKGLCLDHNLGNSVFISKRGVLYRKILHSPFRLYYIVRNGLYLIKIYSSDFPDVCKERKKIILITVKNNLFYGKKRVSQIRFIVKGLLHYMAGKYGKLK